MLRPLLTVCSRRKRALECKKSLITVHIPKSLLIRLQRDLSELRNVKLAVKQANYEANNLTETGG